MRFALPCLALLALAVPAQADARGTRIAMAMALLDVAAETCAGRISLDEDVKTTLYMHFHEYDIAGLASVLSQPLNAFYEDFAYEARQGRDAFCRGAPEEAARTGYPVLLPAAN